MFHRPLQYQQYLTHHGLIADVYKAMDNPDMAETVLAVLSTLRKTNHIPPLVKELKSESKSTTFRTEGNQAYARSKYQKALIFYNKALLYSPKNSRSMKLAYSNRSALLFKMTAFSACLNDIETCFDLDCPMDIIDKLKKRRDEAQNCLWIERLAEDTLFTIFSKEYFEFYQKRNPQIPCASSDVGVIVESHVPKIVTTTDVKVGAVLAVEMAFVSHTDPQNSLFSCYYCHKMSFNLIPCNRCVYALFCDNDCRDTCMDEYHRIECEIIEVLETISSGTMTRLSIKALLKMRMMSKSWKELISASYVTGIDRMKSNSINQIYDFNSIFSLLSVKEERHFLNGPLYNASFICATIIYYLEHIASFFPKNFDERMAAVRATGRLLMYLTLYSTNTQIILCVEDKERERTELYDIANYGWFSLIGKLRNSCNPNVLAVGLNKRVGLVALQPIKRGTELTISYVGHWLENPIDKDSRHRNMFTLYGVVCNCLVCTEDYKNSDYKLTEMQKKNYRKLNLREMKERFNPRSIPDIFMRLCKTLAFLSDVPYSGEYKQVYEMFRKCIMYLQDYTTSNVMLDCE